MNTLDETDTLAVDIEWLDEGGDEAAVTTWLSGFLSLNDDLAPVYEAARDDPVFTQIVDTLYGLHHVRFSIPFEAACWTALSQQTPDGTRPPTEALSR